MSGFEISIRAADICEKTALEALQKRASLANPADRAAILANPESIELPLDQIRAGQVFVAEQGGDVTGFAVVLKRNDGEAELDGLFVEPDIWKNGTGRALVDHTAKIAREQGASLLHVIGNPHVRGFYIACGFIQTGSMEMRFGRGLLMRRHLLTLED